MNGDIVAEFHKTCHVIKNVNDRDHAGFVEIGENPNRQTHIL